MKLFENVATEAIASFFYNEPLWKKEILFNFLLKPKDLSLKDISDITTQESLVGTIPDFTIKTVDGQSIRYEVKINDAELTESEQQRGTRDIFLIRKRYYYLDQVKKTGISR